MSLLLMFGAGASYGAGSISPSPPPLGRDLFAELTQFSQAWASVPTEHAGGFHSDFEVGMESYYEASGRNSMELMALTDDMARYFGRFTCSGGSHYDAVVEAVGRSPRRIVLSSLNYDLLLEEALVRGGLKFCDRVRAICLYLHRVSEEIARPSGIPLLKPHGSANFYIKESAVIVPEQAVPGQGAGDLPIDSLPPHIWRRWQRTRPRSLGAAMSLFMHTKEAVFGTLMLEQIRVLWEHEVMRADHVYVIGVALRPDDVHIWEPIKKSNALLTYVGLEGDRVQEWCQTVGRKRFAWGGHSFAEALPQLLRTIGGR